MKSAPFRGTGTAIVTPFHADGSIDYAAFGRLIDRQIDAGIEAIVAVGSTGEGATLTREEKLEVFRFTAERAGGRAAVVAGTGSNDTRLSAELSRDAVAAGATAVLIVGPFYNKPTAEGYFRHFAAVADAVGAPIIAYNVPGRTASNISAEVMLRIASEIPTVVGVKEASGNLDQVMDIIRSRPEGFAVYSGEDSLALPIIAAGGDGVIAVVSNEVPKKYGDMVRAALAGDLRTARVLHYAMLPLMHANFLESNPIPVKAALAMMGLIEEQLRLPLTPLSDKLRPALKAALDAAG
jgi:4-hydroxy-tetrahydrodipicolinate synthase